MFNKIVYFIIFLLFISGIAIYGVFSRINWDSMAERLAERIESSLGYELVVTGDVSYKLFPQLAVSIEGVSLVPFGSSEGEQQLDSNFVNMDSIEITYDYLGVFSDKRTISSVTFVNSEFVFEKYVGEEPSWAKSLKKRVVRKDKDADEIDIELVTLQDTRIVFITGDRDDPDRQEFLVETLTLDIESPTGPFIVEGKSFGDMESETLDLEVEVEAINPEGEASDVMISLRYGSKVIDVKAQIQNAFTNPEIMGVVEAIIPVENVSAIDATKRQKLKSVDVRTDFVINPQRIHFKNIDVVMEEKSQIQSEFWLNMKRPSVQQKGFFKLKGDNVNFDYYFSESDSGLLRNQSESPLTMMLKLYPIFKGTVFELDVQLKNYVQQGKTFDLFEIYSKDSGNGLVYVANLKGFPGDTDIAMNGYLVHGNPTIKGDVALGSKEFKPFLDFMNTNISSLDEGALKDFSLNANFLWKEDSFQMDDLQGKLNNEAYIGRAIVSFSSLGIDINAAMALNKLDIDGLINVDIDERIQIDPRELLFDSLRNMDIYFNSVKSSFNVKEVVYGGASLDGARGVLRVTPGFLELENVQLKYHGMPLAFNYSIDTKQLNPIVRLEMEGGDIDLSKVFADIASEEEVVATIGDGVMHDKWSRKKVDLSGFAIYSGLVDFRFNKLIYNDIEVENVVGEVELDRGAARIKKLRGLLFDSKIDAQANVTFSPLYFYTRFNTPNMDVAAITNTLFDVNKMQGRVGISGNLSFSGESQSQWVSDMQGIINIRARNILLDGFDLGLMSKRIPLLKDPREVRYWGYKALTSGVTLFDKLVHSVELDKGVIYSSKAAFGGDLLVDDSHDMDVDLKSWTLQAKGGFNVKGDRRSEIPVRYFIRGSISEPELFWDRQGIEDYWSEKFYGGK